MPLIPNAALLYFCMPATANITALHAILYSSLDGYIFIVDECTFIADGCIFIAR